jgi:hypothetical protein
MNPKQSFSQQKLGTTQHFFSFGHTNELLNQRHVALQKNNANVTFKIISELRLKKMSLNGEENLNCPRMKSNP